MAERRMFAKTIIDSDAFLEMPQSSQLLYFHLSMRADDDGFVNKPKAIMRTVGSKDDDMNVLISKRFVLAFDSGVVVIKHWRIHNYIRKDSYTETKYKIEKSTLDFDENDAYKMLKPRQCDGDVTVPSRTCDDHVTVPSRTCDDHVTVPSRTCDGSLTQDRIGKDRIGKDRIEERGAALPPPPTSENAEKHKHGEYGWIRLSENEYKKLIADLGETELNRCIAYIDESAQSTGNKNKWKDWNLVIRKCSRQQWGADKQGTKNKFEYDNSFKEGYSL